MDQSNNTESKIIILYILKKANKPLSHKELLELIVSVADINYFYIEQYLSDLLEDNYIKLKDGDIELYELTEEGKNTLELTLNLIPGITKLDIDSKFSENFNNMKNKFSLSAELSQSPNSNNFIVTCRIIENHADIFKLETYVGSQEQAGLIINNWNNHAEEIYPQILDILTSGKK